MQLRRRRRYPEVTADQRPYRALLDAVIARQASLMAQWLGVGFIHGVMNTDNMSVAGETIDYGPCAFMDSYHPATVYSSNRPAEGCAPGDGEASSSSGTSPRLSRVAAPVLGKDRGRGHEEDQAVMRFLAALRRALWGRLSCPSWGCRARTPRSMH